MPPSAARKEIPMSDDRTLDDHARRLQRLEDLQLTFGPLVARIDERLGTIQSDVGELKEGLQDVRATVKTVEEKGTARDAEIKALADAAKERKEGIKSTVKWVAGIASTVIIAALLAAFGLK